MSPYLIAVFAALLVSSLISKIVKTGVKLIAAAVILIIVATVIWGNGFGIVEKISEHLENGDQIVSFYEDYKEAEQEDGPIIKPWNNWWEK